MLSVQTLVETMTQTLPPPTPPRWRTCCIDETKRVPPCPCASDPVDNDVTLNSVALFTCEYKILDPSSLAR